MKLSELIEQYPHLDIEVDDTPQGNIIVDAVLLTRDVRLEDSTDSIGIWVTEGLGGVVQYGMVCSAKYDIERLMWAGPSANSE